MLIIELNQSKQGTTGDFLLAFYKIVEGRHRRFLKRTHGAGAVQQVNDFGVSALHHWAGVTLFRWVRGLHRFRQVPA